MPNVDTLEKTKTQKAFKIIIVVLNNHEEKLMLKMKNLQTLDSVKTSRVNCFK
jgi:nitrate reductase NapAB chaperone NapD